MDLSGMAFRMVSRYVKRHSSIEISDLYSLEAFRRVVGGLQCVPKSRATVSVIRRSREAERVGMMVSFRPSR